MEERSLDRRPRQEQLPLRPWPLALNPPLPQRNLPTPTMPNPPTPQTLLTPPAQPTRLAGQIRPTSALKMMKP